jgi:hypothetical protein
LHCGNGWVVFRVVVMMVGPGINLDDLVTSMVAGSTTRLQR